MISQQPLNLFDNYNLTTVLMEHDTRENIRWSVANEMFRIFCFLVYYVALMLLGVAIIV